MTQHTGTRFTVADVGCYVDSHRGQYAGERVQEIAAEHGWTGEQLPAGAEWYHEATDEAETFLNDLPHDPGLVWSWSDGDFGLYAFCLRCGEWRDAEAGGVYCESCIGKGD